MATVLIWMSPEPGHVFPTIKFARDLKQAGHRVVYQLPQSQRTDLEELGFETIGFFDEASRDCQTNLYEPSHSAKCYYEAISAKRARIDSVRAFQAELSRAALATDARLLIVDAIFDEILRLEMHRILPKCCLVARVRINLPFTSLDSDLMSHVRGPMVFLSPRQFELPPLAYDEAFYTEGGPFEGKNFPDFSWTSIDQNKPIIYCSFGSQIERYPDAERNLREVLAAGALSRQFQFVVNAGILAPKLVPFAVENVVVCPRVPQPGILKHVSAMVLHGGFGTIKDCIYNQIPMLVIAQKWDQPMNAVRVQHHGIGLSIDRRSSTPKAILDALQLLTEDSQFSSSLAAMREVFLDCDRSKPTANLLQRLMDDRVLCGAP